METYRCAYRDPHSPLTPLTPVCDVTLRETLRDHSPSLIPIKKIVLDKVPTPRKKRTSNLLSNAKLTPKHQPCLVNIVVTSEKTPTRESMGSKASYMQNLRRILTPKNQSPKSLDRTPVNVCKVSKGSPVGGKRSRFTCFKNSPSVAPVPLSPRVKQILKDIGQEKYIDVFRKEEIDLDVFKILTKRDLMKLDIQEEKDIPVILNAIRIVKSW